MKQNIDIEERARLGEQNFLKGFNCAQSVVAAFADLFPDADVNQLLKVAASFGGGMGRLRMTCGAVTGMFMLAGLVNGSNTPGNQEARAQNYALVQQLAAQFKEENDSLICEQLLGMRSGQIEPRGPASAPPSTTAAAPAPNSWPAPAASSPATSTRLRDEY